MNDSRPGISVSEAVCPLCGDDGTTLFHEDWIRRYFRCQNCCLTFVPPEYHLSPSDEKAVYDHHQNSPNDMGYRQFLSRLFNPVCQRIAPHSRGLDFGSGPGPTLSVMFEEAGHSMAVYDPFYSPDPSPLKHQYDFVTASEVAEHLCFPHADLNRMWTCVKPGGLLGIMTKRARDRKSFADWHYKNDPTHVSFFSRETFIWLADKWDATTSFVDDDVVLIHRTNDN